MLETLNSWIEQSALWISIPQGLLLIGVGLFLSIRLRFFPVRNVFRTSRFVSIDADEDGSGEDQSKQISPLSTLCVSLATVIGNGNIAGVCTAIAAGGPGAVFWMWVAAVLGMSTKFVEATLGHYFRSRDADGTVAGGPMYYLHHGLGLPLLANLFALIMGMKVLVSTSLVQGNSIAVALESQFQISPLAVGISMAFLTWLVVIGGLNSIARVATILSPIMVVLYLTGGVITFAVYWDKVSAALTLIVSSAFDTSAVGGGIAGTVMVSAMRYGIARGAYSNEAGTGTAAVFYAPALERNSTRLGLLASLDVFMDTMVVCTITALAVLTSGVWTEGYSGIDMASEAFKSAMPWGGGQIVALSSLLFGFSSLVGALYYGETALAYLCGVRIAIPYRWLYCGFVFVGAMLKVELAWSIGDVLNGLMTITNLMGVIGLSGMALLLMSSVSDTEGETVSS